MENRYQSRIITPPNLISFFRFLLIPVFIWLYCGLGKHVLAAVVLALSGVSDMLDGYIARRCHMESNLGRVLDPMADKLTQAAMCLALFYRYPIMF